MSSTREALWLWWIGLALYSCVAATLHNPGSLDACYHLHVAENLAAGRGMTENLVWNYLDKSPAALSLPHASHLYWMPMTSWIAWLGIVCLGAWLAPMVAAQVPFVLLAACVPLLARHVALRLGGSAAHARLAWALCLLSPNYLEVWVVPEPVTPFCLAGCGVFWALAEAREGTRWHWLTAGGCAALAHLTRADGALLLVVAAVWALASRWRTHKRAALCNAALVTSAYLLLMAPWFARNVALIGRPLSVAVTRTAWLARYDEIFSYQRDLSLARWLAEPGYGHWLTRAAASLTVVLQLFEMFQWLLLPLAFWGYRRLQAPTRIQARPAVQYAALLLGLLALVFPQPAQYGTLFRGAAPLVPWVSAVACFGVDGLAQAYARLRGIGAARAQRLWRVSLSVATALMALLFHVHRLRGILPNPDRLWNDHLAHYLEVDAFLRARGVEGPVLVVDPPGFTWITRRASIVVPSDGAEAVRAAADRYGAHYLLLEANTPSLEAAWRGKAPLPGFVFVREFRDETGFPARLMRRTEERVSLAGETPVQP